ncbi:hypothetical protein EVAR_25409_1 [Eumeta japonica]|uniref:Uncharacterized protein n=1 Tax=Eumeta variegata TaxID=151549 RepID=A0A4C1V4S3_EUMVA|nr:hypothetical protein EVAR_25409_1 [Eumeta japonica]
MSPHSYSLKCRRLGTAATTDVQSALVRPPQRLPDAEVSDAARLPRCRLRGACPDIVGTITQIVNRCFGGPLADRIDHPNACVAEPCPFALVNYHSATRCPPPHPPLSVCALTRAPAGGPARCVDSLIGGRQARSIRSTPNGAPMRAALIRSASTSVRPAAVGCVCSLSCASLPPSSSTNQSAGCPPPPAGCACAMTARARGRCGDGTGMIPEQWFEPLPPDPSGSYPRREDARA